MDAIIKPLHEDFVLRQPYISMGPRLSPAANPVVSGDMAAQRSRCRA